MNDEELIEQLIEDGLNAIRDRDFRWARTYFQAALVTIEREKLRIMKGTKDDKVIERP